MIFLNVEMNANETKDLGNRLLDASTVLDQNIKTLYHTLDEMAECWEGADATTFLNIMRSTNMVALEKLKDTIQVYGEYLKNVPEIYSTLDEIYASESIE